MKNKLTILMVSKNLSMTFNSRFRVIKNKSGNDMI